MRQGFRSSLFRSGAFASICIMLSSCDSQWQRSINASRSPEISETQPTAQTIGPGTIPVSTEFGHIIVQGYLNGSGPYWCLVDTGNPTTTIYHGVAERLGLEVEPAGQMIGLAGVPLPVGKATSVRVALGNAPGASVLNEPVVMVLPDEVKLQPFGDQAVDVILGGTLFEQFVIQINYRQQTMSLLDAANYQPPGDVASINIQLTDGYPHATGSVAALVDDAPTATLEGEFLIDLGSSIGLDVQRDKLDAILDLSGTIPGRRTVGQISGIDGTPMELEAIPAASVRIGKAPLQIKEIMLLPFAADGPAIEGLIGSLGNGAFRHTGITLDYRRRRIYLH
ncbi:MAG: retropepsin-like aspartic protease [Lysobacteraceae bacterium]